MNDIVLQDGANGGADAPLWDPNSGAALPAHIANAMGGLGSNIPDRMTVPSLSYEGKTWQIVKDGNKTKLQVKNGDGDIVPVPVMRLVILDVNNERGRAFYVGTYNPAASAAPTCWSADGKAPDASVKEKQSPLCASCPQSVKGSKIADGGREMVACSSHRLLAIAPAFDLVGDPLRLKIAVTSDYDKETVEHGWFALRQYLDFLKSRGITHSGLVVTKVKFDTTVAYPKLLFSMDRLLSAAEVAQVVTAIANPKVKDLLAEKWTAAGSNGTPTDESDIKPHGLEGAYADGWIAHPDSAGWSYKGTEVIKNDELAARYPAPVAAAPAIPATPEPAAPAVPSIPVAEPEPAPVHDPLAAAVADGWIAHPTSAGWFYKGDVVIEQEKLAAQYPAQAAAAPEVAAAPAVPAAPAAEPVPAAMVTPIEQAVLDGWIAHPDTAGYYYKGTEVVATAALEAQYAGNAAVAEAAPQATAAPAVTTSPTDAGVLQDPAVQGLLDKWTA